MVLGSRGSAIALGLVLVLIATLALAGLGPSPGPSGPPPLGVPEADTEKNCYLPAEEVVIILRNVGTGTLFYGYRPNFVVWNETIGYVREATDGYPMQTVRLRPGENMTWRWDGYWDLVAGGHKGELVPPADYIVIIQVLQGFPNPELVAIAGAYLTIGGCVAQIGAGEDLLVEEGQTFTFNPIVQITGNASVTSVTWDLDPAVDANGDGNATNDADLVGRNAEHVFGDDGIYPVVMNLRGFGQVGSKTRLDQDVVFAIDSSGSMATSDPFGSRKDASKGYVDRLAPDDRAAVVDFDDFARLANDHHLSMDYAQVKADIDTIDAAGGSYLAGGIRLGLRELQFQGDPTSVWIEIFISDGDSTVLRDVFDIPRAIDLAKDLGVKVYTVGLRVPDLGIEALLQRIANETGGRYFPAATTDNLAEILEEIGDDVNKTEDRYFVVSDEIIVTVRNADPTVAAESNVTQAPPANLTLRVAGEKFHDVRLDLLRDDVAVGTVTVVRMPGSPDAQAATLVAPLYPGNLNVARVVYTPLDDPVNGQVNGADPVWVNVTLPNGTYLVYHHTFNVQDPEGWVWEVDLSEAAAEGAGVATLAATVTDPGSDDVTIGIEWGDGATESHTYFFDAIGPDPFPSPGGGPVSLAATFAHAYRAAGTYVVTLTVTDDDGGRATLAITLVVA